MLRWQVVPLAWLPVTKALEGMGGSVVLRKAIAKAGPVVTDNGNFILDVDFGAIKDPRALNAAIVPIVGVVETGLFCGMAVKAYFGMEDGSVQEWTPKATEAE
jgi:ribose 5-phosphate isomerase A